MLTASHCGDLMVNLVAGTEPHRFSGFQNTRSGLEWSPQVAELLPLLLRQRWPLSCFWEVNIFWVGSQRWGGCQLPFLYCCCTLFYNPVAFKGRRALNYTKYSIYPFIPSDQVSEKTMMWKIFKQNPSLSGNLLLLFIDLIWEWNAHLYNCVYNLQHKISSS